MSQNSNVNRLDWDAKFQHLEALAKDHPEDGKVWLRFALFLKDECDNPLKTVHAFEEAQRLLPHLDCRLQLGTALVDAGRAEEGIALLEQYVNEKPVTHGYGFLASNLIKLNRFSEAKQVLLKAIKLEPDFEESYYKMGEVYRKDESLPFATRNSKSAIYYRKALKLNPEYQAAWHALGRVLTTSNEITNEGIDALQHAIGLNPKDGWTKMSLAEALERTGRIEEAEAYYKRAIEELPEFPECRSRYADFLNTQGRHEEAESVRKGNY